MLKEESFAVVCFVVFCLFGVFFPPFFFLTLSTSCSRRDLHIKTSAVLWHVRFLSCFFLLAKDPDCEGKGQRAGAVQSRCSGAHHCSTSIPQLSVLWGLGTGTQGSPPVQIWGLCHQKHAMMLQLLPWSILCYISHLNSLFTDTGFLLYVSWPERQNYMGSYSSVMENTIHCLVEQGGL